MSDELANLAAVWIVPSYPWAGDSVGGIFHQTQARAVSRAGVAVRVVSPCPWTPWPLRLVREQWARYAATPRSSADGQIEVDRPRFLGIPGRPEWLWPDRQIETSAWRTTRSHRISIVHGHFAMPHGVAAVRLGARLRRPVVVTLHGSDINLWPTTRRRGMQELRAAVHGADVVIAVSDVLADRTKQLTGRRPLVLPVGIDLEAMTRNDVSADKARGSVGWPLTPQIVTYVGSLTIGKGVRELVAAADQLPPGVLVMLIGEGPIRRELAATGAVAAGRVQLVGEVSHDVIRTYLRASDLLVLPSRSEGLPTVLVEAGAMGIPVVATAVGGIPALLGENGGWLVEPGRPDALGAAITEALHDRAGATRRASDLRRTVVRDHDAATQAARLIGVYRALAG